MSLEQALAANTAALERLLAVLTVAENTAAIPAPAAEEAPAPKTKRTKKEAAPEAPAGEFSGNTGPQAEATAPSPGAGAPDAPATEAAAPATKAPATYDEAAAAVTKVVKALGTPKAKEMLARLGGANLKQVDPSRFDELIAAAEALLGTEIPF